MSVLPKHLLGLSKGDLESLCVDCGLCCYASVRMDKGQVLVPELRCQHLSVEKSGKSCCSVYEYRHDVAKSWCLPLAEAIEKSVFPSQCPYVADIKDYVGSAVLSDAAYQMVRPQIQKHLSDQVRPGWASATQWSNFTDLMKSQYTGPGTRTGSPGNYTYTYDDDKPKKTRTKKEEVDLDGDLSQAQVKHWRGEMRKMSKLYRAISKDAPGWGATDDEKAAFEKKFNEEFEEGRAAFRNFTNKLETWGRDHMLQPKDHELTQQSVKSAFWILSESHSMFPTSWSPTTDDYHPDAYAMGNTGEKALVKMQRRVKAALDVAERYIADKTAADELARNPPTATAQVRGVNFVVHGRGLGSEHTKESVDRTIRQFVGVADKFEELGIEKALEGLNVQIHSQYNKELPHDLQVGGDVAGTDFVAGFYRPSEDMLSLLPLGQGASQGTLVHEIGHRIYYKLMESNAREAWKEDADSNRTRVTPKHVDDFIENFVQPTMFRMSDEDWTDSDKAKAKAVAEASDELKPVYEYLANNLPGYKEGRSVEGAKKHLKELLEGEAGDGWVDSEYVSDYAATNAEELFAEAFKHYVQKGPGSVPPKTRKRLRESFRAAGIPFTKSMRDFLDLMGGSQHV